MSERKACPCCGTPWKCTCAQMLQEPETRCLLHPTVRVATAYERMDFEKAWDERVEADRGTV